MNLIYSSLFLLAATGSGVDAAREFADISDIDRVAIWDKFQAAFGVSRVNAAFSSPESLLSAIVTEDEASTHVGCSVSYEYGSELGTVK